MINKELLESFIEEAAQVLIELSEGADQLRQLSASGNDLSEKAMASMGILSHRLKGSSALYGFTQVATLAGLLERMMDSRPQLDGEEWQMFLRLLDMQLAVMGEGLAAIYESRTTEDLGLEFSRRGGSALLQELVRRRPDQFQMRARHHLPPMPEPDEEEPPQQEGLEGQLQKFLKDNPEVWEYFAPEVSEHIANLRTELEKREEADLNLMFRSAHTIKGSSYMVDLPVLGNFAHRMEDLLGAVREDAVSATPQVWDSLGRSVDIMEDITRVVEGADLPLKARLEGMEATLRALLTGDVAPVIQEPQAEVQASVEPATRTTIRVTAAQLEGLVEQVGEVVTARARITRLMEKLDGLQTGMQASQNRFQRTVRDFEERYLNPDMVRLGDEQGGAEGGMQMTEQFAELEFDTYNDLNILSRSITELSADFAEVRRNLSETVIQLYDENERLGKLLRQLRLDITQTSRVPFSQAGTRLQRWARQQSLPFTLTIEGEDVLLESSIVQRVVDPLLHLLTNAVYHGLAGQDESERLRLGKPAQGQILIKAEQQQNYVDVIVADDGAGICLSRVREKALERGLRSGQEIDRMSDAELQRLILLPGFSTAQQVGNVTGRGVGMDVVATAVRQLGGELLIRSEQTVGTVFTLRLPTTQRILDVLQVQLGDESQMAAFPITAVRALRDISQKEIHATETGLEITFEGRAIPLVDTRQIWGFESLDAVNAEEAGRVVILNTLTGEVAARVREFGRIEEVAVTPPSALLASLEYMAGTAVSTAGEALVLLEPTGLLRLSQRPDAWLTNTGEMGSQRDQQRILLVDDSLSVRRLVGKMLERGGLSVVTANDGQEALDMLQVDQNFDAVISDLEMPRMNGYELLSAVRGRPDSANLPFLIMTTRAGEKHQRLAFQLGATDYFTKPVNEALLLRRLATLGGTQGIIRA